MCGLFPFPSWDHVSWWENICWWNELLLHFSFVIHFHSSLLLFVFLLLKHCNTLHKALRSGFWWESCRYFHHSFLIMKNQWVSSFWSDLDYEIPKGITQCCYNCDPGNRSDHSMNRLVSAVSMRFGIKKVKPDICYRNNETQSLFLVRKRNVNFQKRHTQSPFSFPLTKM